MASRGRIRGRFTAGGAAILGIVLITAMAGTSAHAKRGDDGARGGPVRKTIDFTISDSVPVPETPGSDGLVYVVAGEDFDAKLTFVDKRGEPSPLSTSEETEVTLSYVVGEADPIPLLSSPLTLPAGESTLETGDVSIDKPYTDVTLQASAETKHGTMEDESAPFDVLIESVSASSDEVLTVGGGDDGVAGDCDPTELKPVCGDLIQSPDRALTSDALLSQGCLTNNDCEASPTFIQALADFHGEDLSARAPATLIMSCDKSVCGGGAIRRQHLAVSLSPNPDDDYYGEITAPACEDKGVVTYDPNVAYSKDNAPFCVDYVQSKRDIAGDTMLYLLFTLDAKVRFP